MPIHSAGYRPWDGWRAPSATRWAMIASTGIRRSAKSKWLRRMMFFAVLPSVALAGLFFFFEQSLRDPAWFEAFAPLLGFLPDAEKYREIVIAGIASATPEQIEELRHTVWSYLLFSLFRYPQAVLMVLVIGIVAPPLVSQDVRSRAFMIYFSRPITRPEYVLGKFGTVAFFLVMITTLPALVLYVFGVLLSPSLSVIASTWDLPLLILLASAVLILPTTSIALMFSSMTTESRYAGFAWFTVWVIGIVIYSIVMLLTAVTQEELVEPGWRVLLSPYHMLGVVQSWVFNLPMDETVIAPALFLLTAVTILSLMVVFHRVGLPMRA